MRSGIGYLMILKNQLIYYFRQEMPLTCKLVIASSDISFAIPMIQTVLLPKTPVGNHTRSRVLLSLSIRN